MCVVCKCMYAYRVSAATVASRGHWRGGRWVVAGWGLLVDATRGSIVGHGQQKGGFCVHSMYDTLPNVYTST